MLRFRPFSTWTSRSSFRPFSSPNTSVRRSVMSSARTLPDCWGHRGASARFPENTIASFEAAIRDGAEGIESGIPSLFYRARRRPFQTFMSLAIMSSSCFTTQVQLERTTNSTGKIREREWYGADGMEHVRTTKQPHQAIPTFAETVELLMRPENQHANFNVDVKVQNDPARLFKLMHETISSHPNWETVLAPRILLGLWHPSFLGSAKEQLPYCRRSYIGNSPAIARKFFWNDCEVFSIAFAALTSTDGERFRQECKAGGKKVMVWTVNEPDHMMEAVRWGVDVILTDVTRVWLDLRAALHSDYETNAARHSRFFLWTSIRFYPPVRFIRAVVNRERLESIAGPFDKLKISPVQVTLAYMMAWWLGVKL
ncbi:GP-PDE domain-containing protein, partial [Favolaschia claudopus]